VMVRPDWPVRARLLSALAVVSLPLLHLVLGKLETRGAVYLIVLVLIVCALSSVRSAAQAVSKTSDARTDQPLMAMAQRATLWSSPGRRVRPLPPQDSVL